MLRHLIYNWTLVCRVTGKGYMDVNRISGYIPGKMVFFLMQVLGFGFDLPNLHAFEPLCDAIQNTFFPPFLHENDRSVGV